MHTPISRLLWILFLGAALPWLAGCERQGDVEEPAEAVVALPQRHAETGIAWFEGSVDQAFVHAANTGKPVFLYWGAVWCPPCRELKATLFRDAEFIASTRAFVAVYIDGDEEGAQQYQDRFATAGYPTLIVFDSAGNEITRLPGAMPAQAYREVLELALERVSPARELLRRVLEEDYRPSADELHLLAWYSWDQDRGRVLAGREASGVFLRLADLCGEASPDARTRFEALYLEAIAAQAPGDAVRIAEARRRVADMLVKRDGNEDLAEFFAYRLDKVLQAITAPGSPERKLILDLWQLRLLNLQPDTAASALLQMRRLYEHAAYARLRGEQPDAERLTELSAAVDDLISRATDGYERSALLNVAILLLEESGLSQRAAQILRDEVAGGENPWYWMLELASLAERADRPDEALDWVERAFREAQGPATRVQWGVSRAGMRMRLRPQDEAAVAVDISDVFAELDSQLHALHGRNRSYLARLGEAMRAWAGAGGETREAVMAESRQRLAVLCEQEFAGEAAALSECTAIL